MVDVYRVAELQLRPILPKHARRVSRRDGDAGQDRLRIVGQELRPASLSGEAWMDENNNGLREPEEAPFMDAEIRVLNEDGSLYRTLITDREGRFAVALWADKLFDSGNISHAFVIGDMSLFLDEWIRNNTSSTALLLQAVRSLQGMEPVNLDILPISAQREGLRLGGIAPAVIVTVMLPLLVLLAAALVLWPRKYL